MYMCVWGGGGMGLPFEVFFLYVSNHRKMIQLQVHLQLPCYDFCFLY